VDCVSQCGDTPLMDAAANSHADCVLHLLEYGASSSLVNNDGKTALDFIRDCREGNAQDRELILEYLQRPVDSWLPLRLPEFIVEQVIEEAAAIYDHANADESMDCSLNVSRNQSEELMDKGKRRNSDGGNPLSASAGGAYRDFSTKSLAAYWGTEDKPKSAGFSSTREERKFQALLKTLEKQGGTASSLSESQEPQPPPVVAPQPRRKSSLYERKSTYRSEDEEEDAVEVTAERGPYKKRTSIPPPIKVASPNNASSASPSSATGDHPVKRKRGRPRKNPLPLDRLRSETDGDDPSNTSGDDGSPGSQPLFLKSKKRYSDEQAKDESDGIIFRLLISR
jgi:hypothetical protein